MRLRTALKIVARVKRYQATPENYSRRDVVTAFEKTGTVLAEDEISPWVDAVVERKSRRAENDANANAGKVRKEAARAMNKAKRESREAVRKEHLDRRHRAIEAARTLQAKVDAEDEAASSGVLSAAEYAKMGVVELKAACKERGIKGYSKLNKRALIDLLSGL